MKGLKVFGNFTCARCGRRVPYVHSDTPTVDPSQGRITCFRCTDAEQEHISHARPDKAKLPIYEKRPLF